MNADIFITIAFCGIALLVAIAAAAFAVHERRRDGANENETEWIGLAPRFDREEPATRRSDRPRFSRRGRGRRPPRA